jgi:PAS domain S-box-containing protein
MVKAGRLTLTKKIVVLLLLPLVGALADVSLFASYLNETRRDTHFVNVAGRQRMLAAEMRAWVHMVAIGQEEDREGLRARVTEFEQALTALSHGGEVLGGLLDPPPPEIQSDLDALLTTWGRLRPDLETVAATARTDGRFEQAHRRVEARIGGLRDAAHAVVTAFEAHRSRLRAQMFAVLAFTAAGTAAIFLLGLWLTRRFIVRPILRVNAAATRISAGDFSRRLDVDTHDELATLAGTFNDMTEKIEQLLAALHQRRRHAERIVNSVPAGLVVADGDLRVVAANRSFIEWRRCGQGNIVGRPVIEVLGIPELEPHLRHVLATDETRSGLLFTGSCPDAAVVRHLRIAVHGTRPAEEEEERLLVVVEDMSEEERREAHLSSVESRFQQVVETANDSIVLMEQDGTISGFNAAAERTFGWRREEVLGKPVTLLMPEKYREAHERARARHLSTPGSSPVMGRPLSFDALRKDGTVIPIELTVSSYRRDGALVFTGVLRDVTERKRAEEALRRSEESFRLLIEVAPDAVIVHRGGRVEYANPAAASLLGHEAPAGLSGRDLTEFVPADERDQWRAHPENVMAAGATLPLHEHRMVRSDGAILTWEVATLGVIFDGKPATLVVGRDVTERRQMASRMMQMDRMVSIGTLAAGVGHEINNPLSYVIANVDFVAQEMSELSDTLRGLVAGPTGATPGSAVQGTILAAAARIGEMKQGLDEAREGADRVRKIVRDLKTFSRAEEDRRQPVSLQRVLESVLTMAWNEIRHRARLVKDYAATPPVIANDARLGQVVLNLLVNAAQAIPEGHAEANEIRLRTWADSERVFLEVRDTGSGIAPEALPHVFDPFFTTKPVGEGTGLGLSIAHTIVSSLGGEITVESTLGKGTAFRIALPPARLEASEPPPAPRAVGQGRRGRVLVVDDEPMVGKVLERILAADHDVITVASGREALSRLASDTFDIVLCDLMMPEMTGMDLHEQLSAGFPDHAVKMVFLTGGAFTPRAREFLDRVPNQRLEKPFDAQNVRALVREFVPKT